MFPPSVHLAPPKYPHYQNGITSEVFIDYTLGEIARHNADPLAHPNLVTNGGAISAHRDILAATVIGQSVFTLSAVPALPHLSELYINGVKAFFGTEYTINAIASALTWLGITLEPTDKLEIFYQ